MPATSLFSGYPALVPAPQRLSLSIAAILGCSEANDPGLAVPALGTEHVLFGTAQSGRAVEPGSVAVARLAELERVRPIPIGGGDIDFFLAGIEARDLPAHVSPEDLRFTREREPGARPLPLLTAPHVLAASSPPTEPLPLVPVEGPAVPWDQVDGRRARLDRLLEGLAVQDPCREPAEPLRVIVPRIPADAFTTFRTLSSGETWIGLTATGTVAALVITPGAGTPELVHVETGTATVQRGERVALRDLGDGELRGPGGRLMPAAFTLELIGALGSAGSLFVWDPGRRRFVDDTPLVDGVAPRILRAVRRVHFDGQPELCTFGSVAGAERRGAIWCHPEGGASWRLRGDFGRGYSVTEVLDRGAAPPLALDLGGTVHRFGQDRWTPLAQAAVNAGCDPLCSAFSVVAVRREGALRAVLAGARTQVLQLFEEGGELGTRSPSRFEEALFVDERANAVRPLRFTAAAMAPDGAVWLASARGPLLRLPPGAETPERICLPPEAEEATILAMEATADGRLLLGMSPAYLGVGSWRVP